LRNIRRDAHFEGLARTSAENQTTVPPEGDRNMSAPTERADPDLQLQAAWLAQVSDPTEASVSEQAPRQSGHSPRASTDSLEPVDRATEQHVALPLGSVLRRRSGLVMISLIGFILALALPLVIGIPQLPETWREPAGGHTIGLGTSEPLTSAIPGVRDELESPKLLVQSSRGVSGEPAPIGVTVRGRTDGAVVTIKGLLPGMELSTGGAVAGNTWQISASDLQYAWVAPPKDFVGSADLIAELRLPNAQIADRQTIRLEWTRPAAGSGPEPEPFRPPQISIRMIRTLSPRHRNLHRHRTNSTAVANRVRVLARTERTICIVLWAWAANLPLWRARLCATACMPPKDFGIGRGEAILRDEREGGARSCSTCWCQAEGQEELR
jgi:hypothetical protein